MYIYRTTNLVNRKIYIGQSIKEVNKSKNYFGSGTLLLEANKQRYLNFASHEYKKYKELQNVSIEFFHELISTQ